MPYRNEVLDVEAFIEYVEFLRSKYTKEYNEHKSHSVKEKQEHLGMLAVLNTLLDTFNYYNFKDELTMKLVKKIVINYYKELSKEKKTDAHYGKMLALGLVKDYLVNDKLSLR